jgi:hypothetical protein
MNRHSLILRAGILHHAVIESDPSGNLLDIASAFDPKATYWRSNACCKQS